MESERPNDVQIPLNDNTEESSEPVAPRLRKRTTAGESSHERAARMRIKMDEQKKRDVLGSMFTPAFKLNLELAIRVAVGVLIASAVQTRKSEYIDTEGRVQRWYLFPEWYYLGGLSYCAVAVIFTTDKNIGATIHCMCQAFYGVGLALIYNIILFYIVDVHLYDPEAGQPEEDGFFRIDVTFDDSPYYVNAHNFWTVLPWIMLFTIVVLILPLDTSTKKFSLANNLYFALTIIDPTNPQNASQLKREGDSYFETANTLHNLEVYFLVGFIGTVISILIMFIPYPIFAVKQLKKEMTKGTEEVLEILNLIVDSYCFKNKNVDTMKFLKLQLQRKFDDENARHLRMKDLLTDVWWEQLFGLHSCLKFNLPMLTQYTNLLASLLSDLAQLNSAMRLEKYGQLHLAYMKVLQRDIYQIQNQAGEALEEIQEVVVTAKREMNIKKLEELERHMERTLHRYRMTQTRQLRQKTVDRKDVEGNVPLNLFLFSLHSFCSSLKGFETTHNSKVHSVRARAIKFIRKTLLDFVSRKHYDQLRVMNTIKVAVAIFAGTMLSIYVYNFSSTTPATVAYVMGNHIGGSFSVTVNRVGGVVAGSVVPSVFQFFISQVCDPQVLNTILTCVALFIWVTISMYVRFSGGYGWYAGLVSAFVAAGILLKQSDVCLPGGSDTSASTAISSYSTMAQTSIGIILFILVELALIPQSATSLLRKNIQETMDMLETSFVDLFNHHVGGKHDMDEKKLTDLRQKLQVLLPEQLAEQKRLLQEADTEPELWNRHFSYQKYEEILKNCHRLLNHNNLLYKLMRWFSYRVADHKVSYHDMADIREHARVSRVSRMSNDEDTRATWDVAATHFLDSTIDDFKTLRELFGDKFMYSDPDQTAVFLQMKEAFRLADKDGSGEIDSDEVATMLENIFFETGAVREEEIQEYVSNFMAAVDADGSGTVSFEEFMDALQNGLKLEVEVYQRHKRKAKVIESAVQERSSRPLTSSRATPSEQSRSRSRWTRKSVDANNTPVNGANSNYVVTKTPTGSLDNYADERVSTPSHQGQRNRRSRASTARGRESSSTSNGQQSPSPFTRRHDVLDVNEFELSDLAGAMKTAYVAWLMDGNRFEKVTMEELLLFNCLISGAEGVAHQLMALEQAVVSD